MHDVDDTAPDRIPQLTTAEAAQARAVDSSYDATASSVARRHASFAASSHTEPHVLTARISTRAREAAAPLASSCFLRPGACFGRYRVVRWIGEGGMSQVYEAIHVELKKGVALKVLRPELARDPAARARFVNEGENAARIRHPNVVDVTDVGVADDLPYLVMALLEGECLSALYARQGALPYRELVDLLLPVASAMEKGHEQGIVHRDLKPDNILLHREGRRVIPKVLDFGISIAVDARRATRESRITGTPAYMSPEQVLGDTPDVCTDQYAFGVLLYEGLTGHLPRDGATPNDVLRSVAYHSFRPPSEHIALPEGLEAVILRAMARHPSQRFASMRDLALALVPFASESVRAYWASELALEAEQPSEAFRVPAPYVRSDHFTPAPRDRRARRWRWTALAAVAVGALWLVGAPLGFRHAHPRNADLAWAARDHEFALDVQTTPEVAALVLDGRRVGAGRYRGQLPKDGAFHELQVLADGYAPHRVRFRNGPPPSHIELTPLPAPASATSGMVVTSAAKPAGEAVRTRPQVAAEPAGARASAAAARNPAGLPSAAARNLAGAPSAAARNLADLPSAAARNLADLPSADARNLAGAPRVTATRAPAREALATPAGLSPTARAAAPIPSSTTANAASDERAATPAAAPAQSTPPAVRIIDELEPQVRIIE